MRNLAVLVLVLAMVGLNTAYWMGGILDLDADEAAALESDAKRAGDRSKRNNEEALTAFKELKRRDWKQETCLPYKAPCPFDGDLETYPFLRCCHNGICSCNAFASNCKCDVRLSSD